ncbi:MAG: hypothetical protein ACTSU7_08635 [Candidatus Heimdallarchaeaceae archaeon]
MDVIIFKGTLQKSQLTFGLLEKRKVLGFQKEGKYLVPRDKNKELIKLTDEFDFTKIKKNSKETVKAVEFYLNNPEVSGTSYGSYLIEYYINEMSKKDVLLEELDEDGKNFFKPILENILKPTFFKKGSFSPEYYKESKVLSRYVHLDFELVFTTILRNIEDLLFNDKKPIAIFPLRYSVRSVTEEDITKIGEITSKRMGIWFDWRSILRKASPLYNYIIYWIHEILEKMYPEDQEAIKEVAEETERAEVISNADALTALQKGEDLETEDISKVSMNKQILYYFSMQYLFEEKAITFKKYDKTTSFGYHDLLISMSNIYTSIPLFTSFNPPFSMISGGLVEWLEKDLSFRALQGNREVDPYNIMPNALAFYLSLVFSKTPNPKYRKYLLAKSIEKILSPKVLEGGIKWQKQTNLAMQGKDALAENIESSEDEIKEKQTAIAEMVTKYVKELKVRKDKQTELDAILDEMDIIDKEFEEMKEERDKFLKIDAKYKKDLSDFQKDFILTVQLFEKDKNILNSLGMLFDFINQYILLGNSSSLHGFSLLLWIVSLTKGGTLSWLQDSIGEELSSEEECKVLSKICVQYNTSLQGMKIRQLPLIETTAPTVILQATQNLSEILVAKDIAEKEKNKIYSLLLSNLSEIYI